MKAPVDGLLVLPHIIFSSNLVVYWVAFGGITWKLSKPTIPLYFNTDNITGTNFRGVCIIDVGICVNFGIFKEQVNCP